MTTVETGSVVVSEAVKSAYAADLEKRGVMAVGGIAVPTELGLAMQAAIEARGITATAWIRHTFAQQVNRENVQVTKGYWGLRYQTRLVVDERQFLPTPKVEKAKPLTQKQQIAKVTEEAAAAKAEIEALKAELAAAKAALVPTPPTVKADAETGKVVAK